LIASLCELIPASFVKPGSNRSEVLEAAVEYISTTRMIMQQFDPAFFASGVNAPLPILPEVPMLHDLADVGGGPFGSSNSSRPSVSALIAAGCVQSPPTPSSITSIMNNPDIIQRLQLCDSLTASIMGIGISGPAHSGTSTTSINGGDATLSHPQSHTNRFSAAMLAAALCADTTDMAMSDDTMSCTSHSGAMTRASITPAAVTSNVNHSSACLGHNNNSANHALQLYHQQQLQLQQQQQQQQHQLQLEPYQLFASS
jgi:hypothetical protein